MRPSPGQHLPELHPVQHRGLAGGVQAEHEQPHLFVAPLREHLREHAVQPVHDAHDGGAGV